MTAETLPRLAFTRAEAAVILGVSPDLIKKAQNAGHLKAKNTSFDDKTGKANGVTLYAIDDLRAWFNGLGDA